MRQLLQRLDNGTTTLVEVPVPSVSGPNLLVETRATVISAGTERMLVEFGRSSLLEKARRQPDKVKQVLAKVKTDGLGPTMESVRAKLDAPIPLGYCHAGVVVNHGTSAGAFAVGDRVVTNGPHSEYVRVPHTLAAKIPEEVSFEAAAFTPIAAIGLQGVRLAAPTLGETCVVYGLGLIGLLTVQVLRANGCRVIGIDRDNTRLQMAERFGAVALDGTEGDVAARVVALTDGIGADAVLLTLASASDEPVHQAAQMSRKRGRLVLVGVTGLSLTRDDFYKKELSFAVSCSYGPGRYDQAYEEGGLDYPLAFVRWTEQRNFQAVLGLMADRRIDPLPLITHRFDFESAPDAYEVVGGAEPSLGIVLSYGERDGRTPARSARTLDVSATAGFRTPAAGTIGVVGAGNFATRVLIPLLRQEGARLRSVASGAGTSASIAASKFGFERVSTDVESVLGDDTIDTVFLLTRHDLHASMAVRALRAGKNVFVEKPLALTRSELSDVEDAVRGSGKLLMVGFNRRFAPLTLAVRDLLKGRAGPVAVVVTVNAGAIPRDHWTQDPQVGGGRIVGEACHWMDLARVLVGAAISSVAVVSAKNSDGHAIDDIAHIQLSFADGSIAAVHYISSGASSFPKERVECFFDGKTVVIDNWRRLRRFGVPGPLFERSGKQDKGHGGEIKAWMSAVRSGGPSPIPITELLEVSQWSIVAAEMARAGSQTADRRPIVAE